MDMNKGIYKTLHHFLTENFIEPYSALTHLIGAIASFGAMVWLAILTFGETGRFVSVIIYGVSQFFLYVASTVFHAVKLPEPDRLWLNKADHIGIYLLIAGTYTPFVFNLVPDPWRFILLTFIWGLALTGILLKMSKRHIHGFISLFFYVILGWGGGIPILLGMPFHMPLPGQLLILAGGLIYTFGFITYYWQRPDPWPEVLGHHEIWHLMVMAAGTCHFLAILIYVA